MMLSIPVWGVESRNATVAALLAPLKYNDMATGITLHEHRGSGTPNADALTIGQMPLPPRCLRTFSAEIKTDMIPAIANPKRRYGAMAANVAQNSINAFVNIS